jgi:hypothetical protein
MKTKSEIINAEFLFILMFITGENWRGRHKAEGEKFPCAGPAYTPV